MPSDEPGPSPMPPEQKPTSPPGKPSLDNVLNDYQVEDDTVLNNWEADWPASMFMDPRSVTQTEADLINNMLWWDPLFFIHLPAFNDAYRSAFDVADARFAPIEGNQNDNHNDAFRHAYWNALMTSDIGEEFASQYDTAHEGLPGNQSVREAMDLYNNQIGREIAAANPGASHEKLADLIEEAVKQGDLLVIDKNGNLAWSDQVAEGDCGAPVDNKPLPGRPRDEFEVDAGS